MGMYRRIYISSMLLIVGFGLSACLPSESATPTTTPTYTKQIFLVETVAAGRTASPAALSAETTEPAEDQPIEDVDLLLITPTLAPTATPGFLTLAAQQVVNSTDNDETLVWGLAIEDWINLFISFVFVVIAWTLISRVISLSLKKLVGKTTTSYDDLYFESIKPYIRWFVGLVTLDFATERLQFLSPESKQWLSQMYFVLITAVIVVGLLKMVSSFTLWYREKLDSQGNLKEKEAIVQMGDRTVRSLLIVIGSVVILSNLGFNISALLTAFGIGGLAISLAAQETIANMISGIIILIDGPFRVGDRIEIQGLDTWGDVVDIGLRTTRIRTLDNRMVIVPNSSISKNQIVNYTFPDPRYRIQTEIGVAYESDLRKVREVITQSLRGVEGVVQDKPVDILFMEFRDFDLLLRVRWWIESYQDARRITDRVNEAILYALQEAKVEIPDPKLTVVFDKPMD